MSSSLDLSELRDFNKCLTAKARLLFFNLKMGRIALTEYLWG